MKNSNKVTNIIKNILFEAINNLDLPIVSEKEVLLEHPTNESHGDNSSNIAMKLYRGLAIATDSHVPSDTNNGIIWSHKSGTYKSPRELAQAIVANIQTHELIDNIAVEGPGFINFTLSNTFFNQQLQIILNGDLQKLSKKESPEEIIVEYSSPNIAKPFTIGHLRSTIIGDSIANLLEFQGHKIYRDNHLGDWGTQFGKQIYAIKTWGNEDEIEKLDRPVKKLVELYVKFHQEAENDPQIIEEGRKWFKKLEDGDLKAKRLWQKCIDWSWKEFNFIYEKLNIKFTENDGRGYGESFFEDKMDAVVAELDEKNLLQDSEGAKLVFFPEDKYPPMMIIKNDGATLYATRDLATDKFRLEKYGKDITIINEVGAEQSLYFSQLFELEKMLGWVKEGQRVHVKHGLYRFSDKKMSTRKGNVIWLEDVLTEAYKRVKTISGERISEDDIWKVAIGALKWNDLKSKTSLNTAFDWDEIVRVDGNSGPYIQYTYARCKSVLLKAKNKLDGEIKETELNAEEKAVLKILYQFPEYVESAANDYAPHHLCTYLFELAQRYNVFYNKHHILEDSLSQEFRLQLTRAVSMVIKNGLEILGIETPSKM